MRVLRISIVSADDTRAHRDAAEAVVERLQGKYWRHVRLAVAREDPVGATGDAVCLAVLGSLPGFPLPTKATAGGKRAGKKPPKRFDARALETVEKSGAADVLIYRTPPGTGRPTKRRKAVDGFIERFLAEKTSGERRLRTLANDDELERQIETDVEAWLLGRLKGAVVPAPYEGCPYRTGPYEAEDAPLFFGREAEIAEALDRLHRNRAAGRTFLLVAGGAGQGKSSFARAGVAPRLVAPGTVPDAGKWRSVMLMPEAGDGDPVRGLAEAIAAVLPELERLGEPWTVGKLAQSLAEDASRPLAVAAVVAALDRISAARPAQLLVTIDALDPLAGGAAAVADRFFTAVLALASTRRVWLVATLRAEFLPRVPDFRALAKLAGDAGTLLLPPPDRTGLREIIRLPALAAGLRWEDDLAGEIEADAASEPNPLPPLADTLARLHERREGDLLTRSAYRAGGGLRRNPAPGTSRRKGWPIIAAAAALVAVAGWGWALVARDGSPAKPAADLAQPPRPMPQVAAAAFDAAGAYLENDAPAEALPRLAAALRADPDHPQAREVFLKTLGGIRWHVPVARLDHPLPPRAVALAADGATVWVTAGADGLGATLRWNPGTLSLAAVVSHEPARGLSLAPGEARLIVDVRETLLLDAATLAPLATLPIANGRDAPPVHAWSADGLLLAFPTRRSDGASVLSIVDAATAQTVRESEPLGERHWLALALGRDGLRAVAADGSLVHLPLLPNAPVSRGEAGPLTAATFSADGRHLMLRAAEGTGSTRHLWRDEPGGISLPEAEAFPAGADDFAWSQWDPAALELAKILSLEVAGNRVSTGGNRAPLEVGAAVTSVAGNSRRVAVAAADGSLVVHEFLPALGPASDAPLSPEILASLDPLAMVLGGVVFDSHRHRPATVAERAAAAAEVDPAALAEVFPQAESGAPLEVLRGLTDRSVAAAAWRPLWDALAAAHPEDDLAIARLAAEGETDAWSEAFLRGAIGRRDVSLHAGEASATTLAELEELHRLAGDSPEIAARKADAAAELPLPSDPLERAEAHALRGETAAAREILDGLPDEVVPDLRQAHFLVASGLATAFPALLERALAGHDSPWLWQAWLAAAPAVDAATVAGAMNSADGRGPVAAAALRAALEKGDAPAIRAALEPAEDLPEPLATYAAVRAAWLEGNRAEVFATWPLDPPPDDAPRDAWNAAFDLEVFSDFTAEVGTALREIEPAADMEPAALRELAAKLLKPETAVEFGPKRVRDAMLATALVLATDPDSTEVALSLVETARLAGADPVACLRAEARALMTLGQYGAAYSRWLQVLEAPPAELIADDFLEAAHCVLEDDQDLPALALLERGRALFPADATYALNSAWLTLSTGHSSEAAALLEHGFGIGFGQDQQETAMALRASAAEQNGEPDLAEAFLAQLVAVNPAWAELDVLDEFEWPPLVMDPLRAVAKRAAGEEEADFPEPDLPTH